MDSYRVLLREPGPTPDPGRACAIKHHVNADSFTDAVISANALAGINFVVMEVALARPELIVSDAELMRAIDDWCAQNHYVPDDIAEFEGYQDETFVSWVENIVAALRDGEILPELSISLCANNEGFVDYTMLELYGFDGNYRSHGSEIKHLTEDRSAVGAAALLAIAQTLVAYANQIR